jgi:glycosyltransferase involved in cell wall biosynthesis
VESILSQSFTDFEFLIIDDHSQDGTYEYLQTLTDSRIKLIRKPVNSGYANSLNMGLDMARGEYIARMDGDDIALPERFAKQVKFMDQHPGVVVAGTCYKVLGTDAIVQMPLSFEAANIVAIMQVPVAHPTVFIRRSVLVMNRLRYNETLEPTEDYDLWTRLMEYGRIENLPEALLLYRRHSEQESITKFNRLIEAAVSIRERQLKKLLNFDHKPYDLLFAIAVLTKQPVDVSSRSLKILRQLLLDMYESNASKKVYDEQLLYHYLRDSWVYYIVQFNKPHLKDTGMLLKIAGNNVTRMGMVFYLKSLKKMLKF